MIKKLFSILLLSAVALPTFSQFGLYASAVYMNVNGSSSFYNNTAPGLGQDIGSINFQGADFGTFEQNAGGLKLAGAEIKTYKGSFDNVCSGTLFYTVYPNGSRPVSPVFNPVNLGFYSDCFSPACTSFFGSFTLGSGGGCCSAGDQKWQNPGSGIAANIDLTTYSPGTYTLELYYAYNGQDGGNGCGTIKYDNNNSNPVNYTAAFTLTTPVPVKFGNIHVNNQRSFNTILWNTFSEAGSSFFRLERSLNGTTFNSIGEIPAAGYSSSTRYYSMRDPEPGGLNYYRVKMIEADGKFQYSAIVKSVNHFKDNWNFIYVPGNDHIEVNGIVRGDEIRIYDLNGRMIRSNKSTGNKTIINTTGIANGTYFISVLTDLQLTTRQLIILR